MTADHRAEQFRQPAGADGGDKSVREKSGNRILPALYSNYVALMPGEKRTIQTELEDADTRGERPRMVIEGLNLAGVAERWFVVPDWGLGVGGTE